MKIVWSNEIYLFAGLVGFRLDIKMTSFFEKPMSNIYCILKVSALSWSCKKSALVVGDPSKLKLHFIDNFILRLSFKILQAEVLLEATYFKILQAEVLLEAKYFKILQTEVLLEAKYFKILQAEVLLEAKYFKILEI